MDLYKTEKRIKSAKERFSSTCEKCFNLIEKFERTLKINDYSNKRILKYWITLRTLHNLDNKCFEDRNRKDIEEIIIKIDATDWSQYTKSDMKKILRFFYRWMLKGTIEDEYPDIVKGIKTRIKKNNQTPPEQILTKEEINLMVNRASNPRDKALVSILYESGCRISELLHMKIMDINFDEFGCHIMVSGKTGWRRARIIDYSKNLMSWLDIHPLKANRDSYVWTNLQNLKDLITPNAVNKLLKNLAGQIGITKPVNPHAFRHARATHLAKHLPEAVMKQLFGWTNDSKMAAVYNHLSGKDVDDALLRLHGIKKEDTEETKKPNMRICSKCGTSNSILSHFCKKCNTPLDLKFMIEVDNRRKELDDFMKEFLVYLSNKNENFKQIFRDFVKERKYDSLFEELSEFSKIQQNEVR